MLRWDINRWFVSLVDVPELAVHNLARSELHPPPFLERERSVSVRLG